MVAEEEEEDDSGGGGGGGNNKRRRRWGDRGGETSSSSSSSSSSSAAAAAYDDDRAKKTAVDDAARYSSAEDDDNPNKVRANFALSGALAADSRTGNARGGIALKFSEPPEARIPNTRWRLYVFRRKDVVVPPSTGASSSSAPAPDDDGLIDTYHISRQSSYLFGRERKVADIPVDHPSLSKQHAVLQYRALPSRGVENRGGTAMATAPPPKVLCRPYLMDLESTNGTFLNGIRLDPARYYELRRGDVITFGASTREYVLLTERSARTGI